VQRSGALGSTKTARSHISPDTVIQIAEMVEAMHIQLGPSHDPDCELVSEIRVRAGVGSEDAPPRDIFRLRKGVVWVRRGVG